MPADNTLNFTTNVDLTGLNAGLDSGQGAIEEFSAEVQASVAAVDAVWDVFVAKTVGSSSAFEELLTNAIRSAATATDQLSVAQATSNSIAAESAKRSAAGALSNEAYAKATQIAAAALDELTAARAREAAVATIALHARADAEEAATATAAAMPVPVAATSGAETAEVAGAGAVGAEDVAATDAMAAAQASVAEQTVVVTDAMLAERAALQTDIDAFMASNAVMADSVGVSAAAATATAARTTATEVDYTAQLRDQAAVNAYTAASAKGTVAIKAMGAAYNQAIDAGLGETEALEAAVAAADASTVANNANTGSLEANTAAMAVNRGEAMGTARVIASSMAGNVTGMEYGLARIAASSKMVSGILQTMMPVAIWAVGIYMLYDMGSAYYDMYTKAHQAGEALALEGNKNVDSIMAQTAAINVENDKLQEQIDKFEHVPNNGLKTTLDEAIEAADKLQKSLAGDSEELDRLLKAHNVSYLQMALTGVGSTTQVGKDLSRESQGRDLDEANLRDTHNQKMLDIAKRAPAAKTKEEKDAINAERVAAESEFYIALETRQQKYIDFVKSKNDEQLKLQRQNNEAYHGLLSKAPPAAMAAAEAIPGLGAAVPALGEPDIDFSPTVAATGTELAAARARLQEMRAEQQQGDLQEQRNAEPPKGSGDPAAEKLRLIEQMKEQKDLQESLATGHGLTPGEAEAFWQPYLDAFKQYGEKGVSETNRVMENYVRALDENHTKFQAAIKKYTAQQDSIGASLVEAERGLEEYHKELAKISEDVNRSGESWAAYHKAVDEATGIQELNALSLDKVELSGAHALGIVSGLGDAHRTAALDAQEYDVKLKSLNKELADLQKIGEEIQKPGPMQPAGAGYAQNQTQQQSVSNQISALQGQKLAAAITDNGRVTQEIVAPFEKAFKTIETDFFKAQQTIINGTESVNRAFSKMGIDILESMETSAEKMVLAWAAKEAKILLIHELTNMGLIAGDTTAAVAQKALAMSAIKTDAATAAANTFNAISGIPFVGPFLAPAAAAVAYGAVMAYETFDTGGVIPGSGAVPILGHGGERVLTAGQTNTFDKMVTNMTSATSNSRSVHLNYNPRVSAYDSAGLGNTLRGHSEIILGIVQDGLRQGKLSHS